MSVCKRCGLRGDDYVHFLNDDDDLIVRAGKSEAQVTNKRLRLRLYC